jgi:hypothetical protein
MTASDYAASLIREGAMPQAAFHAAAHRMGQTFAAVQAEYNRRQRVMTFHFRQRDADRERAELAAWNSGATATEAERAYYQGGKGAV